MSRVRLGSVSALPLALVLLWTFRFRRAAALFSARVGVVALRARCALLDCVADWLKFG